MRILREFFGIFRNRGQRNASLEDLNDTQLHDIGYVRLSEHRYRKVQEPLTLDVLFPKAGGTPAGRDHDLPTRPGATATSRKRGQRTDA